MASVSTTSSATGNDERLALLIFVIVFPYIFFRNAWITEDAFINFRVIENFLSGEGPVWNIGERVQVFTSPLWMLLTTGAVAITGEFFFTTIFLSFGLTTLTLSNLYFASLRIPAVFFVLATILLLTRCFVDYSSSGLETPLVALTLSCFVHLWCRLERGAYQTLLLTLVASLCVITRHDSLLLTVPFLVVQVFRSIRSISGSSWLGQGRQVLVGAMPLFLWTAFSVFYYGSPVPNSANAKIVSGNVTFDVARQATRFFEYMQHFGPVELCLISAAVFISAAYRTRHLGPLLSALLLFTAYLFSVGGDYMAGRFFVGPSVVSAIILANIISSMVEAQQDVAGQRWAMDRRISQTLIFFPLVVLVVVRLTGANSSEYIRAKIVDGIADERGIYYGYTDFITVAKFGLSHPFRTTGEQIRESLGSGKEILIACHIGMVGYYAGANRYIVDPLALSDAFLGRMPLRTGTQRVGHFERYVPRQYLESVVTGENRFTHPLVRQYYDDIVAATRKPLLAPDRWGALLRLNGRHYRDLGNVSESDLGGPVLIDGDVNFVMHSCLGGQKTPVYVVREKVVGSNRLEPFRGSAQSADLPRTTTNAR
ncbi:MAG TPA: hypothetical protein PLO14_13555 [Accumulibacter sp.]|uniref:hypothetical protein n=1 Tax=Accumulibacter sp. TaxID=2053492 RepID=UPI0025DB29BF|nr:hypothetical protein [Accumulibacter sp.]MCM8600143.1 hypothetical protein [Accumulibacter sp.]MCM8662748.1 hypothetical protein [Accumulibacter sp.]HNC53242.1 hypothetical protein [Accumulibacter sp.]